MFPHLPTAGGIGSGGGGGMSPGTAGAISTGLGGLAGSFPDNSKTTGNTLQNSFSSNAFNTGANVDIYNLMQTINDIVSGTQGTSNLQTTGTATPTMSPETQQLMNQLINRYSALSAPSLTGYGAQQTGNINAGADVQRKAVDNILASRGLSTSPAAATAQAGIEQNRINQITGMQQQLPILQNQLNMANLAGASGFFSTIPKGTTTTGTQSGQTTQDTRSIGNTSQIGHQIGGTQTSGYGTQQGINMGKSDQSTTSGGGFGGAASGAAAGFAAILPFLMASDKNLKKDIRSLSQEKAIEKVRELKGRIWTWKGGAKEDSGVVAQEIQEVLPELVHDIKIKDMDIKAVNYAGIIPYLIGAVQNLDSRVNDAAR